MKLLSNNIERDVLPLNKESVALSKKNHPVGKASSGDTKLRGPLPIVKILIFEVINNSMVLEALLTEALDHQR